MLSGSRIFNSAGEDITPMCQEASAVNLNDGNGQCMMKDECELYCDDCAQRVQTI